MKAITKREDGMKNFRIVFTETELRGGRLVDVECGTKWLDEIEFNAFYSGYMHKRYARRVYRS